MRHNDEPIPEALLYLQKQTQDQAERNERRYRREVLLRFQLGPFSERELDILLSDLGDDEN